MTRMALAWIPLFLLHVSPAMGLENSPELRISVYNEACVPDTDVAKAEATARYVLERAGVHVLWTNRSGQVLSGTEPGRVDDVSKRLYVHILQQPRGPSSDVFGMAFSSPDGLGRYIDVFYDPIQALSYQHLSSGELLGYVIAHEIGHLLLGLKAHSRIGIMKPNWGSAELREASMGQLLFSAAESSRITVKFGAKRIRERALAEGQIARR